jgi:hypothetical protein
MATYRQVKGYSIKSVSSNPDNIKEGQIWYNDSTKQIKVAPYIVGTWSSGGNLINDFFGRGSSGTQTAGLVFGGRNPGPVFTSGNTEEYNGSSWSEQNNMGTTRRYHAGFGLQTAAVACAGAPQGNTPGTKTEEYNGTSWTAGNDMSIGNNNGGGTAGIETAAFFVGASPPTGSTEEYDGTNWSSGGSLNTARSQSRSFGTLTAGVAAGGGDNDNVEHYDGTSWTAATALPSSLQNNGTGGTQTAGYVAGGKTSPSPSNLTTGTFEYDGSTWRAGGSLANTRDNSNRGPQGTIPAGLICGGKHPFVGTEEYTGPSEAQTKSVDVS